ncbi:MAG TPA: MATE family efflux transporter [Acetobacteraceae bacterium]|jgi:putative MATE family efflux protein|nr:MATE family efflux transporter [Acetobacteraceae bacterium]
MSATIVTDRSVDLAPPALDKRTRTLLDAPLLPLLLRLAAPNILLMLAQSATGLIETYFVGKLGTDALAGVSIVFPGVMLMQMLSAGAMGGGISSSIARALGAGRKDDASNLVWHALVINGLLGLICSVGVLLYGESLYVALGGKGGSLRAALDYSNIIYAGAILLWAMNALSSAIRGTGNMLLPAVVVCGGALLLIPISPALIFGWGPFPRMGVAGGATALVGYYVLGIVLQGIYLFGGRSVLRPRLVGMKLKARLFGAILKVGGIASLSSIQTNLAIMVTTGMVGSFGPAALAGFGTGSRLEYLMVPIAFGVGGPLVAIVGTNIGAGQRQRALRAAWIGAAIGFGITETIGLLAAAFPVAWLSLFDTDPAMLATGTQYLRVVGPFYGFFGLGLVLYFASQGAGRMAWPVTAQFLRLVVAAGGSAIALRLGGGLVSVFAMIGIALAVFGLGVTASIAGGAWSAGK